MSFQPPPTSACWKHHGLREGFEVAYFIVEPQRLFVEGTSCGMQDGAAWIVSYRVALDDSWHTRSAWVQTSAATGSVERRIESDGAGRWRIDGAAAARLEGCLDIDLEASALTNAFPVHRLRLGVGEHAAAPAAYVRVDGAAIDRLDQQYCRVEDRAGTHSFQYAAPAFDFTCRLLYDEYGLVVDYPGIATRVG